jgi:hypothetical protein
VFFVMEKMFERSKHSIMRSGGGGTNATFGVFLGAGVIYWA